MEQGSRELSRAIAAYAASLAFALSFLITTVCGGGGLTAVVRGGAVAAAALVLVPWLARPALSTVFAAMARDRAAAHRAPEDGQ